MLIPLQIDRLPGFHIGEHHNIILIPYRHIRHVTIGPVRDLPGDCSFSVIFQIFTGNLSPALCTPFRIKHAAVKIFFRFNPRQKSIAVIAHRIEVIIHIPNITSVRIAASAGTGACQTVIGVQTYLPGLRSRLICHKISIFSVAVRPLRRNGIDFCLFHPGALPEKIYPHNEQYPQHRYADPIPLTLFASAQDQIQYRSDQRNIHKDHHL